jgi:hypothetical protein
MTSFFSFDRFALRQYPTSISRWSTSSPSAACGPYDRSPRD